MRIKLIIGLTVAAVIGISSYALGHMGGAYGTSGHMHGGPWMHSGQYGDYDYRENLTDDQIKAIDKERSAYLEATRETRQQLYSKELELKSELYKGKPEATKIGNLQKEISELESRLDQKHIDHVLKMKKITPNDGRGFRMGGYHMGYGYVSPEGSCWR